MKNVIMGFIAVSLVLTFAACSPKAKIVSSWVDSSLQGYGANNILVIGVSRDEVHVKLFENVFVDQFDISNIQSIASYKVIGHVLKPDRKIVEAAILETGASSVLITHVVGNKSKTRNYPGTVHFLPGGYYNNMFDYYGRTYGAIYSPASSITKTTVRLESNLYDAATASLVWSAQSDAIDPKLLRTDYERVVNVLIADMKNKGVLK
ncbi:MAG: hypothetical protein ACI8ZB_001577 [Desulforhopalus sp.]|jgi:hypothetical protein